MRWRLREEVATYNGVRDNFSWPDHAYRTLATASAVAWLRPASVCDPACGDGSALEYARKLWPIKRACLNDLSPEQVVSVAVKDLGPHTTVSQGDAGFHLMHAGAVDLVVLTEILEHVENPDQLVRLARLKGKWLVASSPLGERNSANHEHVWGWDKEGYEEMLRAGGWEPLAYTEIAPHPFYYIFQLWVCR